MKWTITTEQGVKGTITLENLTFECDADFCDINMDVANLSDDTMTEVAKSIQLTKINNNHKNISIGKHDRIWSNEPVVIDYLFVCILLQNNHQNVTSHIDVSFHDAKNKFLEDNAIIPFNLMPEHLAELKTKIIKTLVDKFF